MFCLYVYGTKGVPAEAGGHRIAWKPSYVWFVSRHVCVLLTTEPCLKPQVSVWLVGCCFVFKTGSFTFLELSDSSKLAGQGASGTICLHFPRTEMSRVCHHTWVLTPRSSCRQGMALYWPSHLPRVLATVVAFEGALLTLQEVCLVI